MTMIHTPTGRKVQVLSMDSDPSCLVWVFFCDNPEQDAFVPRTELEA